MPIPETPAERARSERAYIQWLQREAAVTEFQFPNAADELPEEDKEEDDE